MKRILVIAGSDSSGGAGLEADQKVIAAHGSYAMTATTALTAQNTQGVAGIHETPSDFVRQQIDACVEDIGIDAVKTGMLASASTIHIVAESFRKHDVKVSVVDPVMVATSGARLLPEAAVHTLCKELLPLTYLITPNIPEAKLLLQAAGKTPTDVHDLQGLKLLAAAVHSLGPKNVLIKGGHLPLSTSRKVARTDSEKAIIANVLYDGAKSEVVELPYQSSRNTHGTGCTLASAIACNLADGYPVLKAVRSACQYVEAAIRSSPGLGKGSGPLNHFHSIQRLPFSDGPEPLPIRSSPGLGKGSGPLNHFHSIQRLPFSEGHFIEYLLDRDDVKTPWHDYTHHDFVNRMGDGTLPRETFKYYMVQDYLYLIQFARANALAGYKAKTMDDIAGAAAIVTHIEHETNLHINECKQFGLTIEDLKKAPEHQACTAYTRFVLDIGQSQDWLALQISLLPCLLGYHVIAERLHKLQGNHPSNRENPYRTWIDNYVAEDYTQAVEKGRALIEKHAMNQSPKRIEELVEIFIHATRMEIGFWDMGAGN